MLTLTRKVGESIRIGGNIVVLVKEVRRNQVRIGIDAPRTLEILRGELKQQLENDDTEAQKTTEAVTHER
jgi:carbon storage regulator